MKYSTIIIKGFAILLLLMATITVHSQSTSTIKGTIQSDKGEKLIAVNVLIQGTDKGTITDEEGQFILDNIEAGTYTLDVSYLGYELNSKTFVVKSGVPTRVDFTLFPSVISLSEISVKGEALKAENSTITVDVIDLKDIRFLNLDQPLRLIEQVPGVDLGAYRQGGVADQFSIRGFGGGGHEGQAGVEVDGVSLNEAEGHADGYADLNILIPLNLKKMKVYKGPSSVLFGRFAQGGTLALETRKGGDYQDLSISGGAFGTFNTQFVFGKPIEIGNTGKQLKSNLAFQFFQTNGYSENSETIRGNVNGRLAYDITDKTDISISLRGHQSEWNAPGYISEAQFNDPKRRNKQDANGENDGGNKSFYSQRLDLNHSFQDNLRLLLFGYSVQQEFNRFAKFGFSPGGQSERFNTRAVYSAGGSLNGAGTLGSIGVDWIAGAEYYSEATDRLRWATTNRVRQAQTEDRTFTVQSISAYAQGEFNISKYFRPSIGLRYDTYTGDFTSEDPGQEKMTNEMNNLSHVSPKLGIRSSIAQGLDLRLSASNGFSLPNGTLKYDPSIELEPIELWQYETGFSYTYREWLKLDVVGFILNSSKEVVENPPGSGVIINAGETKRSGIESQASISPGEGLNLTATYSYTKTEILDNPDSNLNGKALMGIPSNILTFSVDYISPIGIGGRFSFRDVGAYFVAQDNSAEYGGYSLSNFTAFYQFGGRNVEKGRVFIEINNLFNHEYAESVFALGNDLAYAPAPLRNLMVGVNYNF